MCAFKFGPQIKYTHNARVCICTSAGSTVNHVPRAGPRCAKSRRLVQLSGVDAHALCLLKKRNKPVGFAEESSAPALEVAPLAAAGLVGTDLAAGGAGFAFFG